MSVMQAVRRASLRPRRTAFSREVAAHIIYCISGLLVSQGAMLGSLAPFGASLAAAVPFTYMASALFGAAGGYLLLAPVDSFRYIAVLLAVGAVRWILDQIKSISASRFFPPAAAFLPVFATGLALTFSSKSELTEITVVVIEALLAAAGAFFMSRTIALFSSRRALAGFSQQELACVSMSGCILLLSFSTLTIGIVSIGRVLAVLCVLLFARYGFVKGGSVAGIATGIIFALSDVRLLFLSAGYSLSGLMGGILAPMGKAAVVFSALVCNSMMAVAADDRSMTFAVVVETAIACGIFLLLPKDVGRLLSSFFSEEGARLSEEAVRRSVTMRLSHCSKALDNVSSCVNSVSERLSRLHDENADRIFERAAEDTCKSCGLRVYCWEKEKGLTQDDLRRLTTALKENGYVKESDIDENFLKRCCKSAELARSINRSYRDYLSMEAAKRRVTQVRSVVAGQFAGLSEILRDLSIEIEEVDSFDTDACEKIIEALTALGLRVADCSVRRSRGRGLTVEILLVIAKKTAISKGQLLREVSRACARPFDAPSISFEGDRARVTLCELPLYDVEIGTAQHVCDDGALCGDCINYFNTGAGSTVALLSDGMGTGGRAAVDANMAVSIMTKLCKAGLSYDCSLAVVNASLMIKSEEETLATMDMLDFNLYTGTAKLMKAGGCTTFIRKNSKLLPMDIPSLPLGILNEARFQSEDVVLKKDDMVVMVSDGVLVGSLDWLENLILTSRSAGAEQLALHIVEEARRRRMNDHDDDISVIAMKVVENA